MLHRYVIALPCVCDTTYRHNIHLLLHRLCDHPILYSYLKPSVNIIYQMLPSGHVTMYRMLNAQLFLQPQLYLTQNIRCIIRTTHNCMLWLSQSQHSITVMYKRSLTTIDSVCVTLQNCVTRVYTSNPFFNSSTNFLSNQRTYKENWKKGKHDACKTNRFFYFYNHTLHFYHILFVPINAHIYIHT